MSRYIFLLFIGFSISIKSQTKLFADSIRVAYKIPELAYAVLSSDTVFEQQVSGYQRINTNYKAKLNDKFRIGSNTKAITGFIAALLVKQHKIKWDTKFFDLYPELKAKSNSGNYNLTLLDLLTFRTKLYKYTYTYSEPTKEQFSGNEDEQRYQFAKWFLQKECVKTKDSVNFSNLSYVLAGLMLEKVSGKSYKQLVLDLGTQLGISFGFGAPNSTDTLQPWGHNAELIPEAPSDNYKLNWLLAAGNINLSLPDYVKFIQLQLKGLKGESDLLSKEEFLFLLEGKTRFSLGWFVGADENNNTFSYNIGNPGTFLSKVYVFKNNNRSFIILTNSQTEDTEKGTNTLYDELIKRYTFNR